MECLAFADEGIDEQHHDDHNLFQLLSCMYLIVFVYGWGYAMSYMKSWIYDVYLYGWMHAQV